VSIEVRRSGSGRGVFATEDLPAGTRVCRYEGRAVAWADVPEDEVAHVIKHGDRWIVPGAPARFVNHGCEPNCDVDDDLAVVTLRPIAAGEELSIDYHTAKLADVLSAPEAYFWDERWSFDCGCGAPGCRGRVEGWRIV
jgi:uncharacterized protein